MIDLVEFLRARLDEDEQLAREAGGELRGGEHWRMVDPDDRPNYCLVRDGLDDFVTFAGTYRAHGLHIARHDPARVLREVEAKRLLLGGHEPDECAVPCCICGEDHHPCGTLRLFALPYADHPDYREEWRH